MEQEEVQVQYQGQIYTLRVPKGMPDAEIKSYLQRNVGQQQPPRETSALGAVNAFATSLSNSLLLGAPEYINRKINPEAGAYYEQMREDYPVATSSGDIAGLLNTARLAYKGIGHGISALGGKTAPQAAPQATTVTVDTARKADTGANTFATLKRSEAEARALEDAARMRPTINVNVSPVAPAPSGPSVVDVGKTILRKSGQGIGGLVAAQTSAGLQGEARTPGPFGPGFQQGAETFRYGAQSIPGLSLVPGAQQTVNAATSFVPGAVGYGSMLMNRPSAPAAPVAPTDFDMDRRIREEAYRRAMGLQ